MTQVLPDIVPRGLGIDMVEMPPMPAGKPGEIETCA